MLLSEIVNFLCELSEAQCAGDFGQAYHSSSAGCYHTCKESAKESVLAPGFPQLRACHIHANLISSVDFCSQTR